MGESDDLRAFIRDLMARFDRGMDAVLAGQEAQREESRRYFDRFDRQLKAQREESRRHFARLDREMKAETVRLEAQREESRRYFERISKENRTYFERLRSEMEEIRAEGRAGREALFRILDRLDGNGGTAAAG